MTDLQMGRIRFGEAVFIAKTLRVLALLILLLGVLGAIAVGVDLFRTTDGTNVAAYIGISIGSTVAVAALLGAVGYGLEILVDSYSELAEIKMNTEVLEDDDE